MGKEFSVWSSVVALAAYLLRLQQNSSGHLLVLAVALNPDIAYSWDQLFMGLCSYSYSNAWSRQGSRSGFLVSSLYKTMLKSVVWDCRLLKYFIMRKKLYFTLLHHSLTKKHRL